MLQRFHLCVLAYKDAFETSDGFDVSQLGADFLRLHFAQYNVQYHSLQQRFRLELHFNIFQILTALTATDIVPSPNSSVES